MAWSEFSVGDQTWQVDYSAQIVKYKDSGTTQNVNTLYSALMNLFDELVQMDDKNPMTPQTPTEYTMVNGWFISNTSTQYLKNGAITTTGWTRAVGTAAGVVRVRVNTGGGIVLTDVGYAITHADEDAGVLLDVESGTDYDVLWVRPDSSASADNFDSTSLDFTCNGHTATANSGNTGESGQSLWPNLYSLGTIESGTQIYVTQAGTKLTAWWSTGHIDILVRVKVVGSLIDSGNLTILAHKFTDLYDYFEIDVNAGGRNAVPMATQDDLNNQTAEAGVSGWTDNLSYWWVNGRQDYNTQTANFTVGEFVTGVTSQASAYVMYDLDAGTTGYLVLGNMTGAFSNSEIVTGNQGGSATADGVTDETWHYIQKDLNNGEGNRPYDVVVNCNTSGVAETYETMKYITRRTSLYETYPERTLTSGEQYILVYSGYTPVKSAPFGTFAGGKFFGAQGVWIDNYDTDDSQNFQLIDSSGSTQTPPNTVSIKVTSLVSGDRASVFETSAGDVWKTKYAAAAGNNSGDGTIVVDTAISGDTPQAGYVRILEDRYTYASWDTSTFTINETLTTDYTAADYVYTPIIDAEATAAELSNSLIYSLNIPVLIRVRRTGILPFEVSNTINDGGMTQPAIRTTDNIFTQP